MSFVGQFIESTNTLLDTYGGIFVAAGLSELKAISTCLIVWHGAEIALGGAHPGRLVSGLVGIAIAFGAMTFYDKPFPATQYSLHTLITQESSYLANQIDNAQEEDIGSKIADLQGSLPAPVGAEIFNLFEVQRYIIIMLVLSLAQVAMLAVVGFGFLGVGTLVTIGPVFIPFVIVPHLEFLAFGWFRSLITFALYPVIGNAFVFVFGLVLSNWFAQFSAQPLDSTAIAKYFIQIIILFVSFIYGLLKIPMLAASITSGPSISGLPGIGFWR